ncbi:MAG: TonB-dependent receptor [Sphingobacteriales bacterium]|nr:MAG: TonB-dependent receptor [Sphingobacteriales bacterium]
MRTLLLLTAFSFAAVSARAQQRLSVPADSLSGKNLDEVVVTGVAAPVKLQNALSLYKIIDEKQFRAQGAVTVAEALTTQLGLQLQDDPVLGTSVQSQGMSANKVKILIDGLPVNGRENGAVDLGQFNLARIARIEVIQGPMSVVYGSDALGGVINLVTKKTRRRQLTARAFTESIGRYNVDATVSWQFTDRHQLELTGGRNFFEGWGDLDTVAPYRRLLYKPKTQYFGTAAYRYTAPSGFKLSATSDYFREKISNRGMAYIDPYAAYGLDQYFYVNRSLNRLQLEGKAGKGYWTLANSYSYYHRVRESVEKNLQTLTEVPTTGTGDQDTSRFDDITLRSNYSRTIGAFKADGGYDITLQRGSSSKLDPAVESGQYRQEDYALYTNLAYTFWKQKATLQGGLRAAYNSQYRAPLVPAMNLLLQPTETIQIRASYAEGFRAPTLKELYLRFVDQNHEILGNPELRAERSHNYQLSLSSQYAIAQTVQMNTVLSTYYNDVQDGITLVNPTNDSTSLRRIYGNMARQKSATVNIQAEASWRNLRLSGGYGLIRILDMPGSYEGFTVPEVTGNFFWYAKRAKTSFSAFYKYTGVSRILSADAEGNAIYGGQTLAFHQLDASIQRSFWQNRLSLTVGIKNILYKDVRNTASSVTIGGGVHGSSSGAGSLPRRVFAQLVFQLSGT